MKSSSLKFSFSHCWEEPKALTSSLVPARCHTHHLHPSSASLAVPAQGCTKDVLEVGGRHNSVLPRAEMGDSHWAVSKSPYLSWSVLIQAAFGLVDLFLLFCWCKRAVWAFQGKNTPLPHSESLQPPDLVRMQPTCAGQPIPAQVRIGLPVSHGSL